ncbi:hypothetical protein MHN79_12940 [Vibrio sp. Of14-4]|uniref:hypothetical protein n=1 Tax=Vibrio sp. Of14-4 TaxID=2724878 RepID=UPI001EF3CD85|nr:hypothetical protein [Vibrio sp. Of14-4]MCG7490396.1 hypothetical protein [Vibrio sp. Of14-4]
MVTIELEDLDGLLPMLGEICMISDVELYYKGHFLSINDVKVLVANIKQSGHIRTVETHYQVTLKGDQTLTFPIVENKPVITKEVLETIISTPDFALPQPLLLV